MRTGAPAGPFSTRRAAVDRELRFPVEDHEHLFALIVEVRADAALRLDDAAMQEVQVRVERSRVEQPHVVELARDRRAQLGDARYFAGVVWAIRSASGSFCGLAGAPCCASSTPAVIATIDITTTSSFLVISPRTK